MDEIKFGTQLSRLRLRKGVSAREMSLSLGQNASYVNRIENGLSYPSMQGFFYICEYLGIGPGEFFGVTVPGTSKQKMAYEMLCDLSDSQFDAVLSIIKELRRTK